MKRALIKTSLSLAALGLVGACATPKEQCISQATLNLRTLNGLISETEGNISRGYAIHKQSVPYTYSGTCYNERLGAYACPKTGSRIQETPVPIDVSDQRKRLGSLKKQLPEAKRVAAHKVKQCEATYPES